MDVPHAGLHRDITDFAHGSPTWVQHATQTWTEAELLLFVALFAVAWWRSRRGGSSGLRDRGPRPLATALAYGGSGVLKSGVTQERPCRAVAGAVPSPAACPPHGGWSFPSHHGTVAGAAAVGPVRVRRTLVWLTVPMPC
ncbi:hypothetical protein [Streptomyces bullii]|uniref:Transposase n=1 Tax=Streptomyces bullii TaxID=349910 RepID=A0ABW0UMW4_9ACTN